MCSSVIGYTHNFLLITQCILCHCERRQRVMSHGIMTVQWVKGYTASMLVARCMEVAYLVVMVTTKDPWYHTGLFFRLNPTSKAPTSDFSQYRRHLLAFVYVNLQLQQQWPSWPVKIIFVYTKPQWWRDRGAVTPREDGPYKPLQKA